ncbi:NAD-dependent epimerase/dehydratase family protein [Nocardioides sp. cx-173]|uniref:NAD-dependent epimerase/dehydratase family protein n=1 Tax=Nocardioides sp. cx-173 TaxID=2898796 RepID=UPI001E5B5DFB|nr:NAD-dependent epimerase/dehydratase family protein [Nocardioides sp. cx-173]MCD4527173.1 NAD-dependent epimerase/dehydratase family protein [Nocardioides sp. cx-173]UGB40470.1 NAD-dependent epimerase/dehydratase family protein [Nocardioides sp. cx-173]
MRIVITGASGNIGSALLRALSGQGHDLVGVVRRPVGRPAGTDPVTWVRADLTEDCAPLLRQTFRGADAVVHLAWGFQPSHDLDYLERLGVGGTRQVAEAAAAAGVPHLVHLSSVGAYSPRSGPDPVRESYPTEGIPGSPYSAHKVAAERLLDRVEAEHPDLVVARMRPGIVGQRSAGSALLRYGLPALVPSFALRAVPVLPLDRALSIPMVHADDVADALVRVLSSTAGGAFNLAAPTAITVEHLCRALGARHVQVPASVVRRAAALSWHARLQPVDPGWIDLAYHVPLLDPTRARDVLGWEPRTDAPAVLEEVIAGMRERASDTTAPLRPRTVARSLRRSLRVGPVARRPEP